MKPSHLTNFLSGYFHEDWPIEAKTDADIVTSFILSGVSNTVITELVGELEFLAQEHEETHDGGWLLNTYGCYYQPKADALTPSAWLRRLADLLKELSKE
jgi:hypothetical protein